MLNYEDFEDSNGVVDWKALYKAEIDGGHRCTLCRSAIHFGILGVPRQCSDCKKLLDDAEEVENETFVRCPACRHLELATECDGPRLWEDGEHSVICQECDTEFTVSTRVERYYTSPAKKRGTA